MRHIGSNPPATTARPPPPPAPPPRGDQGQLAEMVRELAATAQAALARADALERMVREQCEAIHVLTLSVAALLGEEMGESAPEERDPHATLDDD